jgi:hypothetical protein
MCRKKDPWRTVCEFKQRMRTCGCGCGGELRQGCSRTLQGGEEWGNRSHSAYLEPATSGLSSVAPPAWRGAPGRRASEFRGRTGSEGAAVGASGVSYWEGMEIFQSIHLHLATWPMKPTARYSEMTRPMKPTVLKKERKEKEKTNILAPSTITKTQFFLGVFLFYVWFNL